MSGGPPPPPPPPRPGAAGGGEQHPLSIFSKQPAGPPGTPYSSGGDPAAARRASMLSAYSQYTSSTTGSRAPPLATTGGGYAPPPGAADRAAPPPPPPPVRPLGVAGPPEANRDHSSSSHAPLTLGQPSGSPPPPLPSEAPPKTAALNTPWAPPSPPFSTAPSEGYPRIGGAPRYAIPNYASVGEANTSVAGQPAPVPQPAFPLSTASPPPPPAALPSGAINSTQERTEREVQHEPAFPPPPSRQTGAPLHPSPAAFSAPPVSASATSGPVLATRIGGATCARPGSSRTSSNGRQSPRDLSEIIGHCVPSRTSKYSNALLTEVSNPNETTVVAAVAHHGRPSSRGSSILAGVAAPPAAGLEAEGHRILSTLGHSPNISSGLRRSVPGFLQPGGGDSATPRTLREASSGADSTTTASSRGRKLLEAALTSRGARHLPLSNKFCASSTEHPQQQWPASGLKSQGTPVKDKEAGVAPAENIAGARSEMRERWSSASVQRSNGKTESAATDASLLVPVHNVASPGSAASGTGYSFSSRGVQPHVGDNGDSLGLDTGLLSNAQTGVLKSEKACHVGPQRAVAPLQRPNAERSTNGGGADIAAVNSHTPAPPRNHNDLIAGGMPVSGLEAPSKANTHTPRFNAGGSLPRPTNEPSQSMLSTSDKSTGPQEHSNAFITSSNPTAATMTPASPFRAMAGKSGGSNTAGPPPSLPTASREPPSFQQQQWPHQEQQPRQPPLLHDPPHSDFHGGVPSPAMSSFHPRVEANAPEKLSSPKSSHAAEGVGAAGPPLAPRPPPQQQLLLDRAGGDTTTATGPTAGFTTPRGGGACSVSRVQQQTQHHPLPPSDCSNSHVLPSMNRCLYAMSPYVRDENAQTMAEESPMPQRPLPFDSFPQPEETQRETSEQDEGELDAFDCTHDKGTHAIHRSMQDDFSEGSGTAREHQPPPQDGLHVAPPLSSVAKRGTVNPFNAVLTQVQPGMPHAFQQQPPPLPAQEPQTQGPHQEGPASNCAHLMPPPSNPLPSALPRRTSSKRSSVQLLPKRTSLQSANISEPPFNNESPPERRSSSHNGAGAGSYYDHPSSPNPFLEPDESFLCTSSGVPLMDGANTAFNGASLPRPHQTLLSSFGSVQSSPAQQALAQNSPTTRGSGYYVTLSLDPSGVLLSPKDHPPPPVESKCSTDPLPNFTGDEGVLSTATIRTPISAPLVNPFSKSAQNFHGYMSVTNASIYGSGAISGGASLTGSFVGMAARRKSRRSGAPCFAIFVGGATLLQGMHSGNESDRRGFPCIAVCFNNPNSRSPVISNNARGPSVQPISLASSRTGSVRPTSQSGSTRANTSPVRPPLGAGTLGGSMGICLCFCSVTEALTARGSMVDRKGIRGTEDGRRYVRALTDAVLPCTLRTDQWVSRVEATGAEVAGVMEALKGCVPAPLGEVVEVMLMDALLQKDGGDFVWKDNGGRRLAELLTAASQADSRRRTATSGSRSAIASTAAGAGGTSAILANDALMTMSPLNLATGSAGHDPKERAAALRRVEDLLCTGQRVEAAQAALEAHLYAHALLISMMCPTKDLYLRSVQALLQQELSITSPLAHAYSMFNEMPFPPLVPPPSKAGEEEEETSVGEWRSMSETSQPQQQQYKRQQQMLLHDQEMMQQTWRRHAAILLANFTRHSGDGLLQLATTLHQLHLIAEAHTCLLLLHLTPLGMAGPARAGAEPLPLASSLSPEDVEDLLPRPDQRHVMEEIRRRLGVVGGTYHPTQGCRASFLTPVTILLTQLVQLVSARLDERAPPLLLPKSTEPPVPFHGLPHGQPRIDVGYRMMQVLWLREVGLCKESARALHALLKHMSPPVAFSLRTPPRTLNELVYLFGGVPPPSLQQRQSSNALEDSDAVARGESVTESEATRPQPSSNASAGLPSDSHEGLPQSVDNATDKVVSANGSLLMSTTPEVHHTGPPPPPNPQQREAAAPQQSLSLNRVSLPSSPPGTANSLLTREQRAAALRQPERPAPLSDSKPGNTSAKAAPVSAASKLKQPAPRRSRSLDVLRNFFRRGSSEAAGEEKADEAKPMHLDTEKPPAFDPVTGRWLFEETEEEKRLRELVKAGPPKMAPKATGPTFAPASSAGTWSPPPCEPALLQQPGRDKAPQPANVRPGPGGGAPSIAGREAPLPTMAGRGAPRPGGRSQYVDMFNTS
ncbi:hypothetical protein, conserved [Leishmania tarentolae]|uniref:Sec16 Sec23-binding domain-containing protein n=1 Tax=Leishmania tarentolae TaxID=5689 RepID=A0A640KSF4_LEITA|nr:hypothetical protein, conserved [Leishmania tarentolae]